MQGNSRNKYTLLVFWKKEVISTFEMHDKELYKKVKNDEDIPDSDNKLSLCAILCLIKMDQIYNEDEDGICLLRKKKHNKVR